MEEAPTHRRAAADRISMQAVPRAASGAIFLIVATLASPGAAQTTRERLRELEERVAQLEAERVSERTARDLVESNYSRGVITLGNLRFRLGGSVKIDYVDPQSERDPVKGQTDSPDPHLDVERFRIVPQVDFPRGVSLRAQLDFHPEQGNTVLKEITLDHEVAPQWWFASHLKIGLDDRFIRPRRVTQNYPLSGTAFWRDEAVTVFWEGTLGDRRGRPRQEAQERPRGRRRRGDEAEAVQEGVPGEREATRGRDRTADADSEDGVPSRASRARSTEHEPFDFASNPGALKLHLSVGDGFTLNGKEIGKDNAGFNEVLQDDRELNPPLTLREVGAGVGYERDFRELGELELVGFYYNDELTDEAVAVLQNELNVTSQKRNMSRLGLSLGYHVEAYHLLKAMGALERANPRRGDGLYVFYQWIGAEDGDLDRKGWYTQASYRFSNPGRWRYLRSFEPVVRYSELNVDQAHIASLPLTWSRRQWLLGMVVEIVRDVFLRAEYTVNDETTGSGGVDNNELLLQLLARF